MVVRVLESRLDEGSNFDTAAGSAAIGECPVLLKKSVKEKGLHF